MWMMQWQGEKFHFVLVETDSRGILWKKKIDLRGKLKWTGGVTEETDSNSTRMFLIK